MFLIGEDRAALTKRQCVCLAQKRVANIGLDSAKCGTHSLRKPKEVLIDRRTAISALSNFGSRESKILSAVRYLASESMMIEIAEKIDI
jgi:hypothetical protein